MYKFRRFFFIIVLAIFSLSVFAQEDTNGDRQKRLLKLAEQILQDAQNLQLPENRAIVYAQVGAQLWQTDRKRGEQLFQIAIGELINAQNQAVNESDENYFRQNLLYGQSPRLSILNFIASRDAELALELQLKSRPAILAKTIAIYSADKKSEKAKSYQQYINQETNLENQLRIKAAEQNPERAIELFRESLKSGVTHNTINFLQNLHTKSPEAANKLLGEVFEKFQSMKLVESADRNNNNFYMMINFLTIFGNASGSESETLKFSDSQLRNLADKVSNHWLSLKETTISNSDAAKIIERFFPNRAAQITKKNTSRNNYDEEYKRYTELVKDDATAEELLKEAENFSNYRSSVYSQAAQKLAKRGNLAQAENILNENFSDQEAKMYISGIYQTLAGQEISKGNFERAESIMDQISPKHNRVNSLVGLAQVIYVKNPEENKNRAVAILDKADSLIENPTATLNDISMKINLASAFLQIEPERSFQIIESLILPLNEFSRAQAVVAKFQGNSSTRNGEQLIEYSQNNNGYNLSFVLPYFQEIDFARTMQIINGFERFETRIAFKLQLINQISGLPIRNRGTISVR